MKPLSTSAVHFLEGSFTVSVLLEGSDLVDAGRVHVVKPPPWPVVARVSDGPGYVVTVTASGGGRHLKGDCSCPVAIDCAHAAAAAMVVLAQESAYRERDAEAMRETQVAEWLGEIAVPPQEAAGPPPRVLRWILDLHEGRPSLAALACTREGRRGERLAIATGTIPAWVDAAERRRIALLRGVSGRPSDRVDASEVDAELLRELAQTGRLHWRSATSTPLAYGPAIETTLRLRQDARGYRFGVDEAVVIVPAGATHYVDAAASVIGPLELGVAAPLVRRLLTGPAVPASMRSTVERSLGPLLGWSMASEPLRPVLRACLEPGSYVVYIEREAVYGEERFMLGEWDPARPADRDLVAERRREHRFQELAAGLPHGAESASNLELIADCRYIAEVMVPALRAEGWTCVLDDSFPLDAPHTDVGWHEKLHPIPDQRDWFALELGVEIAGRTVALLPVILKAIRDGQVVLDLDGEAVDVGTGWNLRLPDGELVHVPPERVRRWLRPLIELSLGGLDADERVRLPASVAAAEELPGFEAARDRLEPLLTLAPRLEPPGFQGTLRPYQRVGLAWLHALDDAGQGGLLADEMGLGKTVEVLAFLAGLDLTTPALIVAPRSVVGNWADEARRFCPGLELRVHLGAGRDKELGGSGLVITSYQTLLRDLDAFRNRRWRTLVFDEAQALKNPTTLLRKGAAAILADSRFCITGTPMENHLGELWSLVDLVVPRLLGRRRSFDAMFRRPIEKHGNEEALELLRQRMRPFLLRRTKAGVDLDLPPKTETTIFVELDSAQRDLYEALRVKLDGRVRAALAARGLHGSSLAILDALLKLRQVCCDPRLVDLPEAKAVTSSAKLERLVVMLEELAENGRATLVFSQFATMLDLVEIACRAAGIATLKLTGATQDRETVIRRFQEGAAPVLLASLKAGGVGLNLTRAETVIHYDPWWNPAAEAQASDRAHRIGQDKKVMVYKLVARGTLEETILAMQGEKRELAGAALDGGGVTGLAAEDLEALYRQIV